MEPADWATYFEWNHDGDQARALYFVPPPQSREAVRRWAEREAIQSPEGDTFRFVIARVPDDVAVGDLTVNRADPRTGTLSYGITIKREERRNGYAHEAILLLLRWYFQERRYQKVTVSIYSFNEPSIRLHEQLGFQREGLLRRMVYTLGAFHDEAIYGLTVEEFRARYADFLSAASN